MQLLRAALDAWRAEFTKEASEVSTLDARSTLNVGEDATDKDIRKAYRKLAMKYHPDKNPDGREMFEKIQKAYEMLTSHRTAEASAGPDPVAILLLVKTQCILYARYAKDLAPYKYAGYPLVLQALESPGGVAGDAGEIFEAATRMVFLTCLASPRNAEELLRENGLEITLGLLSRIMQVVTAQTSKNAMEMRTLKNIVHSVSGLATMEAARSRLAGAVGHGWPGHFSYALSLVQSPPIMQHTLTAVGRMASTAELQDALVNAGILYRLIPLLFRFDNTLEKADAADKAAGKKHEEEDDDGHNEQRFANQQAKLAIRALGRLGGYLSESLASPENARAKSMLASMLTPPLAKRLGRSNPVGLLQVLNGHEETALILWNSKCRKELLAFVQDKTKAGEATGHYDVAAATTFKFVTLAEELRAAGVYVRLFLKDPSIVLDDPFAFVHALLEHIAKSPAGVGLRGADGRMMHVPDTQHVPMDRAKRHLRLALRALHLSVVHNPGVEEELGGDSSPYLPSLFGLLDRDSDSKCLLHLQRVPRSPHLVSALVPALCLRLRSKGRSA